MNNNLNNSPETSIDHENINIVSFMLEYIELYINHKKSCNMANTTICNINNALERFITFISDEQHHSPQLSLIDINEYFINNYSILII